MQQAAYPDLNSGTSGEHRTSNPRFCAMLYQLTIPDLHLESGQILREPAIAYRAWGTLSPEGDNAVVVCHSLTSDTDVRAWWPSLVGPGRALDTDRLFVICLNTLGSPYGSTSPISKKPGSDHMYGPDFPSITIRDSVRAHRAAVEQLGVRRIRLVVGGSMGGMQALEWAFHHDLVDAFAAVAVGAFHSPWGIAWTEAQRNAIYADPLWRNGRYEPDRPPVRGLAVARMMAMISYRTADEFNRRFLRDEQPEKDFAVSAWLKHHGDRLSDRFDANCYVHLTRQMNTHDVARGRGGLRTALSGLTQPGLVIGISSDLLYPLAEQEDLAAGLPNARLEVIHATQGHDSFLIESDQIASSVASFLRNLETDTTDLPVSQPVYPVLATN